MLLYSLHLFVGQCCESTVMHRPLWKKSIDLGWWGHRKQNHLPTDEETAQIANDNFYFSKDLIFLSHRLSMSVFFNL